MVLQADGRILIGGSFSNDPRWGSSLVTRMEADGTDDVTFAAPAMHLPVTGLSMGVDGSVFVTGQFLSGIGLLKLRNHPGVSDLFPVENGDLRWIRTGAVPELRAVVFESSSDGGVTWSRLGEGSRVADGWILESASLPEAGLLRARGRELASNRGSAVIRETKIHGRDLTSLEAWRLTHFGSPLNEWPGGDGDDYDRDGHRNLVEYAFGFDPKTAGLANLPSWQASGSAYGISFTKPATVTGITYSAEWSETMREDDWHLAEDLSVGDAKSFRVPVGTEERKFFRLKVANP